MGRERTRTISYERGHAITQAVIEHITPELADQAGVRIRGIDYGPGGYLEDVTPSAHIQVFGSPKTSRTSATCSVRRSISTRCGRRG